MLDQLKLASNNAYRTAMNHPKASSAVVLGTSVAAALVWAVNRNGGFNKLRRQILKRVRGH
jgi:hypothetical protein